MSGSSEQEVLQILFSRLFAVVAGMPAISTEHQWKYSSPFNWTR
jgi:hypothetical protein